MSKSISVSTTNYNYLQKARDVAAKEQSKKVSFDNVVTCLIGTIKK